MPGVTFSTAGSINESTASVTSEDTIDIVATLMF